MKFEIKTALVVAIVVGACVITTAVTILLLGGRHPQAHSLQLGDGDQPSPKPSVLTLPQGNWPMFRGGQRLLGRASGTLSGSVALVWKFKTNGEIKSSPAIDDRLVFIGSSDANIYAISLASGHQVWAYATGGAVEAAPCVVEGSVFVGYFETSRKGYHQTLSTIW